MEKQTINGIAYRIIEDNGNILIISAEKDELAVVAKYNKNYCRRNGITYYHYSFYGSKPQLEAILSSKLDKWTAENYLDKFN